LKETRPLWPPQRGVGLQEPNLGKTNPCVLLHYLLAICFAPSLADSFIFLTLTRLVVVFIFVNFSFALFTPPLGDYHPRIARPVALTPWQDTRHLWQAKRAPFRLRHDDRLKKGVPHYLNLYPFFLFPLSLSPQGSGKEIFQKDPSQQRKQAPSPPTDQGFKGCALRGSATASEHSGSEPFTDQGVEGWPLGRVRQPPQSMQSQG
jgi:hypothetical protein